MISVLHKYKTKDILEEYIISEEFDMSSFSLKEEKNGFYEFVKEDEESREDGTYEYHRTFCKDVEDYTMIKVSDKRRGFILYYDPEIVTKPCPKYLVDADNYAFTFSAASIAEAYVKHNRITLNTSDFILMVENYYKSEEQRINLAIGIANACGYKKASELTGLTEKYVRKCSTEDTIRPFPVYPVETPGSLLKKEREKCGYTQQQMADQLNLSRETISKYEQDKYQIPIEVMKDISKLCHTDVFKYLLAGYVDRNGLDHEIHRNNYYTEDLHTDDQCILGLCS